MNPTDPSDQDPTPDDAAPMPWDTQLPPPEEEEPPVADGSGAGDLLDAGADVGSGLAGAAEIADAAGSALEGAGSVLEGAGSALDGCGCSLAILVTLFAAAGTAVALFR